MIVVARSAAGLATRRFACFFLDPDGALALTDVAVLAAALDALALVPALFAGWAPLAALAADDGRLEGAAPADAGNVDDCVRERELPRRVRSRSHLPPSSSSPSSSGIWSSLSKSARSESTRHTRSDSSALITAAADDRNDDDEKDDDAEED